MKPTARSTGVWRRICGRRCPTLAFSASPALRLIRRIAARCRRLVLTSIPTRSSRRSRTGRRCRSSMRVGSPSYKSSDRPSIRCDRVFADYTEDERAAIKQRFATEQAIAGAPRRIETICLDLIDHFTRFIAPNRFKAQVVTTSRHAAVTYKETLDRLNGPESALIVSSSNNDEQRLARWHLGKEQQDRLIERFKDRNDPGRCCTARSKSLTSLCRLQSHPAQYVSGIPSAAILLSISHPIRCSTRCLANVRARISGPMIAL